MNVLYLLVSLGKSLTFWQTMDEVIKIFVIVAAIAFAAYQNYAKKEKKKNKPSRKKLNKKRKGEGRKHRKLSEEAPQKDALSTAQQPESGSTVRLKTPADARRAFIYSEIFNRKY